MAQTLFDAMASAGLCPHKPLDLHPDGKLVRFRLEGDKAGARNGWAVLHDGFGAFGSWKTGATHSWREQTTRPPTHAERAETERKMAASRIAHAQERAKVQQEARTKAQRLWSRAKPANNAHPYLVRKGVNAYGLRQLRDMLLVPARDLDGTLHTLQFITPDGSKRFLTGGRIAGCYYAIGRPIGSILICEGAATAATLHQATGRAVAASFSCGNMEAVARALRTKFPAIKMILAADNDFKTPNNPGLTKATAAARAVGGFLAVPRFSREVAA
jgi:putative DNA primase/helicase